LGDETVPLRTMHVLFIPLRFIYPAYSAINALIYYVYYVPITFQLVNSMQYFQSLRLRLTNK